MQISMILLYSTLIRTVQVNVPMQNYTQRIWKGKKMVEEEKFKIQTSEGRLIEDE